MYNVGAGRRLHGRRGLKYRTVSRYIMMGMSPPSRAAWIEIAPPLTRDEALLVAAFTGGVD